MLNSLTGGGLRGLAGIAFVVLVPLSATAQDPLTCRAWTDTPIVAGSTPLKAQHINELRACLERIIQHLGVTPVDPLGDITVAGVVKENCGSYVCIKANFHNNRGTDVRLMVWISVYDQDDQLLQVVETRVDVVSGARNRAEVFYGGSRVAEWYLSRGAAHYTLELTTQEGVPMLCSGCGRMPWVSTAGTTAGRRPGGRGGSPKGSPDLGVTSVR